MGTLRSWARSSVLLVLAGLLLVAFGPGIGRGSAAPAVASKGAAPTRGGSLTVLLPSAEWPNLDPGIHPLEVSVAELYNSIFGGLFEFGVGGKVMPGQATGYKFAPDGLSVDIFLRHGLTFSDGTPLRASNVAWSITRTLDPKNGCTCDSEFSAVKSVTASGPYTVVLTLSRPFTPIIQSFNNTAPNWTADEAALNQMGPAKYGQDPVGAGPFTVVSNSASSTLKLTANPRYWDYKHYPLLQNLTFTSVGSDESAYGALQGGQAQVTDVVTTVSLIKQIEATGGGSVKVYTSPATAYEFVALNDQKPPFNNILAREAIYYATNPKALVSHLYHNLYSVIQSPTAKGEDFYIPTVPGYRTYNLAKAKALVKQLGGLTFNLATTTNTQYFQTEVTALASQWAQAGIKVKLVVNDLEQTLAQIKAGGWQAIDSNWGDPDPALALPFYFESNGPFTGTHDPTLDQMINQAAAITAKGKRSALYHRIAQRMNQQAEVPFLYQKPTFTMATSKVRGISGLEGFSYFDKVSLKQS